MSSSTTLLNYLLPTDLFLPSSLPTTLLLPCKSPFLSLPSKPLSFSLSLSLKKKQAHLQTLAPLLVAQTSDWAQQEEESQVTEGEEEEEIKGESEGEAGGIVAEGEDAFVVGESGEDVGVEEEEEEGYPEPPEDAKLFVGNLSYDVDSQRLAELFEKAGVVEVAEVIYNRETDQSRGFGFVTMSTVEEAEKAVEMFHRYGSSWAGQKLELLCTLKEDPIFLRRLLFFSRLKHYTFVAWELLEIR